MDTFGKYLAERARTQYTAVQRIAAQQAALNAQLKVRQGAANVGGPPVPSYTPRPAASVGGAVGGAIRNVTSGIGASVAPYVPVPPPPTIGQRIVAQIVDRAAQVQDTARMAAPTLPPPPVIPMGATFLQPQEDVEPWQVWQSPEGPRVAMPTSYTPPETWTPMGDSFNDPNQIENARQSPLAYDNQPPEIQAQIQTPVNQRGMDIGLDQSRMAAEPGPVTQLPGLQGQRIGNPLARVQDAAANRVLQAAMDAPDPEPVTPQTQATGPEISSAPYIRVRSSATGEVYVIPKERARNLGPDDEVLGTATYQPQESQDRGAVGTNAVDTARRTVGDLWSIIQYGGQQVFSEDTAIGRFLADVTEKGPVEAMKDILGGYVDTIDTARVMNTNNAIDAWMKVKTGTYDLSDPGLILDIASGGTMAITGELQRELGVLSNMVIIPDEKYGITTGGDVTFTEWYGRTSTVVYADGSTANVYNQDIERNPDAFEGATIVSNEQRTNEAYLNGIDTDGDGEADVIGADAVRQMYEADISGSYMFMWQVGMDPLTYIPLVTVGGAKLRNVGRARQAIATSPGGTAVGRGTEIVGTVLQRGGQFIDEASSFGAGIFLDRVAAPLTRRVGEVIGLARESNASRQLSDPGEVGGVAVGIARRADDNAPLNVPVQRWEPERPALDVPVQRWEPAEATVRSGPDPRTVDGGTEAAASVRPPAPRSQPTPNLDRGPGLRTPDGGTLPTNVADGEGGAIRREVNPEGGVIPVSRSNPNNPRFRERTLPSPSGTLDASGIAPRYDQSLVRSAMRNGPDITQVAIDTMRANGRFVDNAATSRAIGDTLGTDAGTVDHALNTADFAAEWNDALRAAGGQPVEYVRSYQASPNFGFAEQVIHSPWAQTGPLKKGEPSIRQRLYATGEVLPRLPANPTPRQMAAAERYADLVDSHLFWNPLSANDEDFQRAMTQAADIRRQLADLEYEGRPTGNIRRGSLLGGGERPDVATNGADDPSLLRRTGDGGFANASQVRKVLLPGENEFGEIGGYPVINEQRIGSRGDTAQTVRLDEDTEALISPIPEARVERRFRQMYPDVQQRTWASALLIDSNLTETVIHHAPDAETAVRAIADEASARGLLNAEAPTAAAPTASPNGRAVPGTTFQTARGSTYRVTDDGKTVRDKAARSDIGHEGQQGIQPESERTFYVTQEDANRLGLFQTQGARLRVVTDQNRAAVLFEDGPFAGKLMRNSDVEIRETPEVGLIPVELWRDGRTVHFGNPITRVDAPAPRTSRTAEPLGSVEPVNVVEASPEVSTPRGDQRTRTEQRQDDVRRVWGDVNPESVPPPIRRAVDDGLLADAKTAVAFHKNVVQPRNWSDADAEAILRALNDIRVANGTTDPIFSPFDLANPATKTWLDQAEELARITEAIAVHDSIIRSNVVGKDAKSAARMKRESLQTQAEALRKKLGWKDPSKATPPANTRLPGNAEAEVLLARNTPAEESQSLLGKMFRPKDKRLANYVGNLKKLETLEFTDAPVRSLTVDRHGLVYFHGAILTDDEIAVLTRHTFEQLDGSTETFLDRWNRYLTESRSSVKTSLSEADDVASSLAMAMREYEALVRRIYPTRELPPILKQIATYTRYLREKILGSWLSAPRYISTQAAGNPMLMALGGYGDPATIGRMYAGINRSLQEAHRMHTLVGADIFDTNLPIMHADRIANQWGTARAPEVRRHVSSGTDLREDYGVVEGFFRRHKLPGARFSAAVFGDTRVIRLGAAIDMSARDAVYATAFHRQIRETITGFRAQATDVLMATGLTRKQAVDALSTFARTNPNGFTSNQVRDFFRLYVPDGKAERLARDWQSMVNRTTDHARSEVSRVLFAGKETRLDAALKSTFMFTYFASRQYYFLFRQALHHPGLINAYAAYNEWVSDYYEAHKDSIPKWLHGYVRVALTTPGFALFLNPVSLLSVGNIFSGVELDFGDPRTKVQEWVENVEKFMFISPLITDTLNILGYLGDGRNVDSLRLMREVETYNLVKNWAVTTGWVQDDHNFSNPILDFGSQIRAKFSGALPGSEQIAYVESDERELRQLKFLVVDEAQNAGITDEAEIDAILTDPSHPIYKQAMRRYLWGETIQFGARMIPILASHRPQVRAISRTTGADLIDKATDSQRRLANNTDESRALRVQEQKYYAIGDSQVANTADTIYNNVAFAEDPFFDVEVDGVTYTHTEIARMDPETRKDLAKAWLADHGLIGLWQRNMDARNQFLSQPENAEYATYKRWSSEVREYPGGIEAYWEQAAKRNENAKQYLDNLDTYLTPTQREKALTNKFAFLAVAGIPVGWTRGRDGEWYADSNYRSPAPKPTNDYDPVNIANQPPSPTPYEEYVSEFNEDLRKDLDNYQLYRSRDEEVLQQIYADFGLSPDTQLATVDYQTSKAIKREFSRRTNGGWITEPDYAVEQYFRWREANGGGTLDEYIAWKDQQYVLGLPAAFSEQQARPEEGQARDDDAYELWASTTFRGDE